MPSVRAVAVAGEDRTKVGRVGQLFRMPVRSSNLGSGANARQIRKPSMDKLRCEVCTASWSDRTMRMLARNALPIAARGLVLGAPRGTGCAGGAEVS